MNLGRLAREASGANGLLRQAASIIANPLVRNKVTLARGARIRTRHTSISRRPWCLLEAKVRLQSPTGKRTLSIRDYLEAATRV